MTNTLSDAQWQLLLRRIHDGKCMPILGAGACAGVLPLGSELAREWAREHGYPLEDEGDLVRVSQFVALTYDPVWPKEELIRRFQGKGPPNFTAPDEPHAVLARLPLPVYMTTNYDDFMVQALKRHPLRSPKQEICRWNPQLKDEPTYFETNPGYHPQPANPMVYHLHGALRFGDRDRPESLVLTEDDFLEFLAYAANDPELLPKPVRSALKGSALLFIGYRVADWNFRVLLHGLRTRQAMSGVAVLKPPTLVPKPPPDAVSLSATEREKWEREESEKAEQQRARIMAYQESYYKPLGLSIYWGTAHEFCRELRTKYEGLYGPV